MVDQPQEQVNRLVIDPLKYLHNLPDFYGDQRDLQTFITLIDRIHPYLQTYDNLSQILFSDIIKSKLKGKARHTIEINCHATSWTQIKHVIQNNFGDRSTCDELFDELRGTTFKTNTIEFYNDVKNKLHRLNNKMVLILGETEAARQSTANNVQTALNIFKSKIPEPMKTILLCRNPKDLEEAMDILFQAGYAHANNPDSRNRFMKKNQYGQLSGNNHSSAKNYNSHNPSSYNQQNPQIGQKHIYNRQDPNNRHPTQFKRQNSRNPSQQQHNFYRNHTPVGRWQSNQEVRQNQNPFRNNNSEQTWHNTQRPEPMDVNTNEIPENFQDRASRKIYPI